jgi:hypothetical protein
MKKSLITPLLVLLLACFASAQSFIPLTRTDASGVTLTADEVNRIESAAQQAIEVLPSADRSSFKVYDASFYVHSEVTAGGILPVWAQVWSEAESDPYSEYYLIFGRESNSQGANTRIRVKLKLPTSSAYSCLTTEERGNLGQYLEQVANDNLQFGHVQAEVAALKLLRDYFYKVVVCNCSTVGADCAQFANFSFLDIQLQGLGFRKKEVQIGGASSWVSGTQDIFDYAGKKVIIDGTEYDIADQVSENKAVFEANSQVLPDTTINTSITGEVYILDNESFTNGEWETAKASALSHDFVEYWVILTHNNKSYLYSKLTLGELQPVAAKPGQNQERGTTISPVQAGIKFLGNAAVDVFFQAIIAYKFDPSVHNFYPDALGKVSYLGAAWEGLSSLIPWKKYTNGNGIAEIALRAASGALVVVLDKSINDPNYSWEQAWPDFLVGFGASVLTQLVFHPKVVAITGQGSRYARLAFSKGVKKLNDNFTGSIYTVSKKTFNNLTGAIPKRILNPNNNADAAIISRVKELRGKMPSAPKREGNFALANVNVTGVSKTEFFAHSGIQDLSNPTIKANLPQISTKPTNEIYPWSIQPNRNGDPIQRNQDSEYKILTEITQLLGDNINASGTIKLFSELDICASCANVVVLFKSVYKKIDIEVVHNNNVRLNP